MSEGLSSSHVTKFCNFRELSLCEPWPIDPAKLDKSEARTSAVMTLSRVDVIRIQIWIYVISPQYRFIITLHNQMYHDLGERWFDSTPNYTNHSEYGLCHWEEVLLCNTSSHWLSPYPEWSLNYQIIWGESVTSDTQLSIILNLHF